MWPPRVRCPGYPLSMMKPFPLLAFASLCLCAPPRNNADRDQKSAQVFEALFTSLTDSSDPAQTVARNHYRDAHAQAHFHEHPHGRLPLPPSLPLNVVAVPEATIRDMFLSSRFEDARQTFLRPVVMDVEDFEGFWGDMQGKAEMALSAVMLELINEYCSFVIVLRENTRFFYMGTGKHRLRTQAVNTMLLYTFHIYKVLDDCFKELLLPSAGSLNKIFMLGLAMIMSLEHIRLPDFASELDALLDTVIAVGRTRSLSDIRRLEAMLLGFLRNIHVIGRAGIQFQLLAEMNLKVAGALLRVVQTYHQHLTPLALPFDLSDYYVSLCHFLASYQRPWTPLSVLEMMAVMDKHGMQSYDDSLEGVFSDCPYYCKFIESCPDAPGKPGLLEALRAHVERVDVGRMESVRELVEEQAEQALQQIQARKGKGKGKGKGKAKGKGKGKAKAKKPAARKPDDTSSSTSSVPSAMPSAISPTSVDKREIAFATVVIGEYIMKEILIPTLTLLSINPAAFTWAEVLDALNSQVNGRLSSRRLFLGKCVEWVRRRNSVAHPEFEWDGYGQLWMDLEAVQGGLRRDTVARVRAVLAAKGITRPKVQEPPFSPFGRPDLGITPTAIKRTSAALRLSQFLLTSTLLPHCQKHGHKPTLALLRAWQTYMPYLEQEAGLTKEMAEAVIEVMELRNGLAHPQVTPQMVRVLVQNVLGQDADHDSFLSYLGRKDR